MWSLSWIFFRRIPRDNRYRRKKSEPSRSRLPHKSAFCAHFLLRLSGNQSLFTLLILVPVIFLRSHKNLSLPHNNPPSPLCALVCQTWFGFFSTGYRENPAGKKPRQRPHHERHKNAISTIKSQTKLQSTMIILSRVFFCIC